MARINWPQAFAEVLLLLVGAVVALAADSWNDRRLERIEETEYLRALRLDFAQTRANLEATFDYNMSVLDRNVRFLGRLDSPPGSIPPAELQEFTDLAFRLDIFSPVFGTYHDMVNSGKLELIQSDSLRLALAQFSVQYEAVVATFDEGFDQWNTLQVPFLVEHANVVEHYGGNYSGVELPRGVMESKSDVYWTREFANILTVAIISKRDILGEAEELMTWSDRVRRHIDAALRES